MMSMLDNHHSVGVAVPPTVVPTMVTMLAEFGACAVAMMVTALDHHGLGTGNRRDRDGDRTKRRKNISKLLHVVLFPQLSEGKTSDATERSAGI
jgi:hypothetical protein